MGCDIHPVLEVMKDGEWVVADDQNLDSWRSYAFFAALAGVRGVGPDPRGVPVDASEHVANSAADPDGYGDPWLGEHSFSWVSREELAEWPEYLDGYGNAQRWLRTIRDTVTDDTHARVVFGFDS